MEDAFFTEQLLSLLQIQSFYAGKLSTISEIDDIVSKVYLPEESAVLNEEQYYHSNKGEPMIELYNEQGFFLRDAKKLRKAQKMACEIIRENSDEFGLPTYDQIESFGISPKGIPSNFYERVVDKIAWEENLEYDEIASILDFCRKLGLVAQLHELRGVAGMDVDVINDMLYARCVDLSLSLDYDFGAIEHGSIIEAALEFSDSFDAEIDSVVESKVKVLEK